MISHRLPVTLEELERRIDGTESGKVKPIFSDEFDAHIARLRRSIPHWRQSYPEGMAILWPG